MLDSQLQRQYVDSNKTYPIQAQAEQFPYSSKQTGELNDQDHIHDHSYKQSDKKSEQFN